MFVGVLICEISNLHNIKNDSQFANTKKLSFSLSGIVFASRYSEMFNVLIFDQIKYIYSNQSCWIGLFNLMYLNQSCLIDLVLDSFESIVFGSK